MRLKTRSARPAIVAALMFLAAAFDAVAQLGMDEAACRGRYGEPVTVQGTSNGVRTVAFVTSNTVVEVLLSGGVVCRATHRGVAGDEKGIERILADSTDAARWDIWRPRGRREADSAVRKWLRSDGSAFAEMNGTVLTVTSERWNALPVGETVPPSVVSPNEPESAPESAVSNRIAVVSAVVADPVSRQPDAAKIPPPKPKPPLQLPAKGDSRDDVVRLLGNPNGTMVMKGIEMLAYPWGRVWIQNGKVVSVE